MSALIFHASQTGVSHLKNNTVCQDASLSWRDTEGKTSILLCADGLGSAKHSDIGSKIAVRFALRTLRKGEDLHRTFELTQGYLVRFASKLKLELNDLATTLHIAVLKESGAQFGIIGDGGIVYSLVDKERDAFEHHLIEDGFEYEYANQTHHLLQSKAQKYVRIVDVSKPIESFKHVSLFTDGMLPLFVQKKQAFAPFFNFLIVQSQEKGLEQVVNSVLDNPVTLAKTDDDRTLVCYVDISSEKDKV